MHGLGECFEFFIVDREIALWSKIELCRPSAIAQSVIFVQQFSVTKKKIDTRSIFFVTHRGRQVNSFLDGKKILYGSHNESFSIKLSRRLVWKAFGILIMSQTSGLISTVRSETVQFQSPPIIIGDPILLKHIFSKFF